MYIYIYIYIHIIVICCIHIIFSPSYITKEYLGICICTCTLTHTKIFLTYLPIYLFIYVYIPSNQTHTYIHDVIAYLSMCTYTTHMHIYNALVHIQHTCTYATHTQIHNAYVHTQRICTHTDHSPFQKRYTWLPFQQILLCLWRRIWPVRHRRRSGLRYHVITMQCFKHPFGSGQN